MLEGKAVVRETDMPQGIQSHVLELAYKALDQHEVSDCQSIAHFIKQHGIVLWAKRLEVALPIYAGVSSSSMWIRWNFLSLRTEETAAKALKRQLEFAKYVNLMIFIYIFWVISFIFRDQE